MILLTLLSFFLSWLILFHKNFIRSILYTHKPSPLGVYVEIGEALSSHFWFLLKDGFVFFLSSTMGVLVHLHVSTTATTSKDEEERRRIALETQVKEQFLSQYLGKQQNQQESSSVEQEEVLIRAVCPEHQQEDDHNRENHTLPSCEQQKIRNTTKNDSNVIISHSCRSIFYYVIKVLLDEQQGSPPELKIATHALHFGSFHRILRGIEKSSASNNSCKITFYEIDMKRKDWTMDENSLDEDELKNCHLIFCQNFFGVPFEQEKLFELGRRYNIPILEDCVQSGSLYGKYKGDNRSDVVIYSGGLDKTPACFGAGFAYFAPSPLGQKLYKKCAVFHNALATESWKDRFMFCVNEMIHTVFAKNTSGSFYILSVMAYLFASEKGGVVQWDAFTLKIRKNTRITPFQHSQAKFLQKPSSYQLKSILHGLSKKEYYRKIAKHETRGRDLLLSQIPREYHNLLFPWLTPKVQRMHKEYMGISEFTWVASPVGHRRELCSFLNEHFVISMINTTWTYDDCTKAKVVKDISDNMIYIPHINLMNDTEIKYLGKVLTDYCQSYS